MNVSAASVRALERHFVGALSVPSRLWLDAEPLSQLAIGGEAVRSDGEWCVVDLGVVESPGKERQVVRVSSSATGVTGIRIAGADPWLGAQWTHIDSDAVSGNVAELELTAPHDVLEQTAFTGAIRLGIHRGPDDDLEELRVRMTARRTHPLGAFDFHGSEEPRGFDFGVVDPTAPASAAFLMSFRSLTSVPMTVRFADLPAWLAVEVAGRDRTGPASGVFFERTTPFAVKVRPHCTTDLLGAHDGTLRIESDDPRPPFRSFAIPFSVRLEPAGPFVRARADLVHVTNDRPLVTQVQLENWGHRPARIAPSSVPPAIRILGPVTIPAARRSSPGFVLISMRVVPAQLPAGRHLLPITLDVEGGVPLQITLPVQVAATARRTSSTRRAVAPAAVAALIALLAFTAVLVLYLRTLS